MQSTIRASYLDTTALRDRGHVNSCFVRECVKQVNVRLRALWKVALMEV